MKYIAPILLSFALFLPYIGNHFPWEIAFCSLVTLWIGVGLGEEIGKSDKR